MKRQTCCIILALLMLLSAKFERINAGEDFKEFPNFRIENVAGGFLTHEDVTGDVPVVISFWATWCKPCIKELKQLSNLQEYKDSCFQILAVSEDGRTRAKVPSFVQRNNWDFLVAYDTDYRLKQALGISDIPEMYILDRDGNIRYHHFGFKAGDELEIQEELNTLTGDGCGDEDEENPGQDGSDNNGSQEQNTE